MSENNTTAPVYAEGTWVKSHTFSDGGEILKLSILVDKFSEFIKKNKKGDGFVNLTISKRKTPDEKSTHTVKLDNWVPKTQAGQVQTKPVVKKAAPAPAEEDDSF